jgi:hypothetical protein
VVDEPSILLLKMVMSKLGFLTDGNLEHHTLPVLFLSVQLSII